MQQAAVFRNNLCKYERVVVNLHVPFTIDNYFLFLH